MQRSASALLALAVVLLACAPLTAADYTMTVLDTAGTFAIVAVGLNLLSGGTGQFSLGHAGFYAIGAFAAGVLSTHFGWPFWLDVPVGGLLAAAAGVALGLPALRLSGPYLAIATLGFGLLIGEVLNNADWAGGRTGITLPPSRIGALALSDRGFFWIILAVAVAGGVVAHNLRRGATGRAFVALRESEPAAQASGINPARYRVAAFAISAGYAGVAGALYAHWAGYISANSFGVALSVGFVAMIVIGGLDSTSGAVLGAVFLTLLDQVLQNLTSGAPSGIDLTHLADPLHGAIIVLVLLFLPGGIMGLPRRLRRRAAARRALG